MVLVATAYSSYETKAIDDWYSELIQHDAKTLTSMSVARSDTMRYGFYLYEEITEPDADKRQSIDVELDKIWREYPGADRRVARTSAGTHEGNSGGRIPLR